jgi:hypothetical protein
VATVAPAISIDNRIMPRSEIVGTLVAAAGTPMN